MAKRRGYGVTTARGYGNAHQKLRKLWAIRVAAGGVNCWRCGNPILPGMEWDLGHSDYDRSVWMGPEHARQCNRAAAGRKAGAMRGRRRGGGVRLGLDDSARW
jgi:hypothetical protein